MFGILFHGQDNMNIYPERPPCWHYAHGDTTCESRYNPCFAAFAFPLGRLPDHAPSLLQPQPLCVQNCLPLVHAIAEQQHRRAVRPAR